MDGSAERQRGDGGRTRSRRGLCSETSITETAFVAGGTGEIGLDYEADGIRYWVEFNDDLLNPDGWWSGPSLLEWVDGERSDNGDGTETVRVRLLTPVRPGTAGFLRARAVVVE